jgi:hypothetical protein
MGERLLRLIGKIILTIILVGVLLGSGLFSYICLKAQARKWGSGLAVLAAVCVFAIYLLWSYP